MRCELCGHENPAQSTEDITPVCSQCGSDLLAPEPEDYTDLAEVVEEEVTQPATDLQQCPSCGQNNPTNNDYCQRCGAPLGVVTRVYKLESQEERDRLDWMVFGIETAIQGRSPELLCLENAVQVTLDQNAAALCLLTGPSGIGKSRLLREFNNRLDNTFASALMVSGKCRDTDLLPYAPIARLIRKRFYIPEIEIPRLARQRLLDAVQSIMGPDAATDVAHLVGYLIGIPFPDSHLYTESETEAATSSRVEERAGQALAKLLEKDAQTNPLILVVEDAHHASEETLSLIGKLATQLRNSPLFCILVGTKDLASRAEITDGLYRTEHIDLAPLADEDIRLLLKDILQRAETVPEELFALVCERAVGNPLIVEEIVRILIGENVIDTRPAVWEIHADRLARVELPQEFEGVIEARLNTLGEEERSLIEVAAVIGQTFWLNAITALLRSNDCAPPGAEWGHDPKAARLVDLLESLRRKDIVRPHTDSFFKNESEFVFKHAVERDLIYRSIPDARRRSLHLSCAQWYELHARLDRFAETMAKHWELGGAEIMAAYRYIQAANLARARYSNRKAIQCYQRAIAMLPPADILTRIEAHHNLGSTLELVGEIDEALTQYQILLRISWQLNAKAKGGMALNKIGRIYRSLGQLNDANHTFRRALTLFQQANDLRGIASTLDDIGKVHFIRSDYELCLKHYRAALELRKRLKDSRSIALSLHHIGSVMLALGEFNEAIAHYRESLDIRKQAGDRQGLADTLNNLAIVCLERGDVQQALRLWEEALAIAQEIGYRLLEGILLNSIGEAALQMGALKTAEASLANAAEISQECGNLQLLCEVQRNLGTIHLKNALYDEAVAALNASLSIARDLGAKLLEGLALKSLGELYAQTLFDDRQGQDPATDADHLFNQAITLLTEVGNDAELGRCHSAYGNYLLEQGDISNGKAQLELATQIFSRLDMKRVLKKTRQIIDEL